jgi:hypothetical protein
VVHGMESSDQSLNCQDIKNIVKDACLKTYIHIQQQLQFQHSCHSYPNFRIKPIFVIIICVTNMVIGSVLQDVLCSDSNLMSSPCVRGMECPQGDPAVSGVVIWLIKVTIGVCPDIRCQQHSSPQIWMTDRYHCVEHRKHSREADGSNQISSSYL